MFLLAILAAIALLLVVTVVAFVAIGGASAIIVFGDVIVCIGVIAWLIILIAKKKRDG